MNKQKEFYIPSGEVTTKGIISTVLINLLVAFSIGYLYAILIFYNPFVYVNFLLTIGYGLAIGIVNRLFVRIGHNRNKKNQIILAALGGFMSLYIHWATYMLMIDLQEVPSIAIYLSEVWYFINPVNFFRSLGIINKYGLWSIFGLTFKGFLLGLIWLFEAFILIFLAINSILRADIFPYSEKYWMWYPKFTLDNEFQGVSGTKTLIDELKASPITAIQELKKGIANRYSKIHIFYLEEENLQYLSIENIFLEGMGTGKKNKTTMICNLCIDNDSAKEILKTYRHKKNKVDLI